MLLLCLVCTVNPWAPMASFIPLSHHPLLPLPYPEKRFSTRHLQPLITSPPRAPQPCFRARLSSPSAHRFGEVKNTPEQLLRHARGRSTTSAEAVKAFLPKKEPPCSQACPLPALDSPWSSVMGPCPGSLPAEKPPKAKPQLGWWDIPAQGEAEEWRMLWLEKGWGHVRETSSQMRLARYGIPGEKKQVLVGRESEKKPGPERWRPEKCQWEAAVPQEA